MTKDGRPSRINDIRYFHGDKHNYLKGFEEAIAFGRRLALYLNGEEFSLGAYPALYLFLTPSLRPGVVEVSDYGGDWWQRYSNVGVPPDFPNTHNASEIVMDATVACLKAIRPELATTVEGADQIVRSHGNELRFLMKTKQTKWFNVATSFNIGVWPHSSNIFTSLTDLSSGAFLEAPPLPIVSHYSAFDHNGPIKMTNIKNRLSEFVPRTRPVFSKVVKRRS